MQLHDQLFTQTLTGPTSFVTDINWKLEKFSVICQSDTAITITGSRSLPGSPSYTSNAVTLNKGESFTWTQENGLRPQVTVTIPSGATAAIIAI